MAKRVTQTTLNATTMDILNVIRQNASYEYQSSVPVVTQEEDIPKVGEILYGTPALANIFINALVNRIALVRVKSATFNNAYAKFKKGYLEYGETVEEAFVQIAKAREFSVEKAEAREFKRTIPDVRAAFHTINWRVQYPVTIQNEDLRTAFTGAGGVEDLIAKIIDSVYRGAEYDEFLLFKYLLIKAIAHGKMYPVAFDATDLKDGAVKFRGMSNKLTFMNTKYNLEGVHTTTDKKSQYIFMDADFNASFDVNVLASAFNMDKADFLGKLVLIDDFTTFDNDRFTAIRAGSTQIEEVTDAELALMADVKAVLVDEEWFQVYDNLINFTEDYVAAGMYWNYFLNIYKTVSISPFSNAVVFVDDGASIDPPDSLTFVVSQKSASAESVVLVLTPKDEATLAPTSYQFVQTEDAVEALIAVQKYGAVTYPADDSDGVVLVIDVKGTLYQSSTTTTVEGVSTTTATAVKNTADVGDEIEFTPVPSE